MTATRSNVKHIVLATAVVLASATCQRQEPAPPPAQPAAPAPVATPAQELPAPDSGTAGAASALNPPAAAPAGPAAPAPNRPSGPAAPSGAGGRQPRPGTPPATQPSAPAPPPAAEPQPAAQQDQGAAVLQRAAAAYANLRALKADFVMHYSNPLLRQQTTSRGTLYQRRPDRVALRFSDPAGDVILSDGQFYWIHYPSVDAQQVFRCPTSEGGEQGAVDLQSQFVGDPVRRFRYTVHGQESVGGRAAHVLTLEPRQQADYRTLKVWLDTRDSLARRFEITELNSTVRRFELSDFEVNPTIPDATFRFTPPANARIVSCR